MMSIVFKVTEEYKPVPLDREDGEEFMKEHLMRLFNESGDQTITIDLNGNVLAYGSSFLDGSFGQFIRETHISADDFKKKFIIKHTLDFYRERIFKYVEDAHSFNQSNKTQDAL